MKILFVYQVLSTFVEKDLEILKSAHTVKVVRFRGIKDIPKIFNSVIWCDISVCWFGKLHAFFVVLFSRILGKKTIIIAGGDDVAHVPEIQYGMFCFWWKKWCPLFVFGYADCVLPVSVYNQNETLKNTRVNSNKVKMVYHGFQEDYFKKDSLIKKDNIVITVASINRETEKKKGLRLFTEAARLLPEVKFYLIGPDKDGTSRHLKKFASKNVIFTGAKYGKELIEAYSKAKVYVQASFHESFGCSLAEAMLCECIPVVSRKGAIPEVVKNAGIYVDELTSHAVADKILSALDAPDSFGKEARKCIIKHFPLSKRKYRILEVLKELSNE